MTHVPQGTVLAQELARDMAHGGQHAQPAPQSLDWAELMDLTGRIAVLESQITTLQATT